MEIMPDGTMAEIKSEPRLPSLGESTDATTAAAGATASGAGGAAEGGGSGAGNTPLMAMDADVPAGAVGQQPGTSPATTIVGVMNGPNGVHFPGP